MSDKTTKIMQDSLRPVTDLRVYAEKLEKENAKLNRENDRLNDELENLKEAYGGENAKLKAELSLAELADEKGFQVVHIVKFGMNNFSITIGKHMENYSKEYRANTREYRTNTREE